MWTVKDHSKLIFSTVGIIFGSFFVNFYLNKNQISESTAGIVLKFNDYIDHAWIKELHEYIATNIDKPYSPWSNSSYTTDIGHCHATCNDDRNNGDIFYGSGCQTSPVYIYDRDVTDSLLSKMPYGEATIPCFLKLDKSKIPNANRGIFTTKYKIPRGVIFGPYTGTIRSAYGSDGQEARDGGYAWRIRRPATVTNYLDDMLQNLYPFFGVNRWHEENADFYIDGVNENNSNWLRYVNTARYREEQNVFSLLFNDTVYYMTFKDIEPETELLVWYGYKYAKWLNIVVVETSDHDWDHDYAPPVSETICPSCPITEGVKRIEHDDDDDENENEEEDPDYELDIRTLDEEGHAVADENAPTEESVDSSEKIITPEHSAEQLTEPADGSQKLVEPEDSAKTIIVEPSVQSDSIPIDINIVEQSKSSP